MTPVCSAELAEHSISSNEGLAARFRSVSRSLTAAIVLLAALVLIGRLAEPALPRLPESIIFTTSSAWLWLLAGLSLWLRDATSDRRWHAHSLFCAAGVIAIASAAYIAHLWGQYHQIGDTTVPSSAVARLISPQSAVAFFLVGFSVLLLDWETRRGLRPSQAIALLILVLALAALVGSLYGVPLLGAINSYPAIPIHESIALLLLGVAVLFARPDRGLVRIVTSDTAGGVLARGLPAAVIAVPMALGWLVLKGQRSGWYDAGTGTSILVLATIAFFAILIFRVARSLDRADRHRTSAEELLQLRARQRASVAELGQRALSGVELPTLIEDGVRLVVNSLLVEWSELLELQGDGSALVPKIRLGLESESERDACPTDAATLPGSVLASTQPTIVDDLRHDPRFHDPRLQARGVVSAVLVAVHGATRAYGVLAAYSARHRAFTDEDVHLLQTVASILAAAHDRKQVEQALRLSEEKFSGLFRSSPDAIAVIRLADGRILEVNEGFLQMTGFSRDEVLGRAIDDLDLWVESPASAATMGAAAGTVVRNVEVRIRTKAGEPRLGLWSTELVTLAGEPCILMVVRDITEHKQVQAAVQEANERLARWVNELETRTREISLLNEMGDLLQTCLTPDEACAIAIQFARQLLPGSSGAICLFVESRGLLEALAVWGDLPTGETMFAPQECWGLRRGRPYAVPNGEAGLVCAHVRRPLGAAYLCVPMMAQGEALGILHVRDAEGPTGGEPPAVRLTESKQRLVVAIAEHVALALANLRLRETLRSQSIRDQLTGLYNRRYLEDTLERELLRARRAARPVGVVLMDLDRFKAINDTHGHDAGDEVLKAVGQLFQAHLRAGDIVCRYGGEEFLFALPEMTLQATRDRAEEIRCAVKNLVLWHRGRVLGPVSVSAGVVVFPEHGIATAGLLHMADAALYQAKANGGDCVEVGNSRTIDMPRGELNDSQPPSAASATLNV